MGIKWTKEKAWDYYNKLPWLRGCNFLSSDCRSVADQWQELGFKEKIKTADRELELAAKIGFNTVRLCMEYVNWEQEHDGFLERFDCYLDLCEKHGIKALVLLEHDNIESTNGVYNPPGLGDISFEWGYHFGIKPRQDSKLGPVIHPIDDPVQASKRLAWIREIIDIHKHDNRIVIWDLFNELGNSGRNDLSMGHLQRVFDTVREVDPDQPLTSCIWRYNSETNKLPKIEQLAAENSDIISFHNYWDYSSNIREIKFLKEYYGRPIICTEWLARPLHNTVFEIFPLFYLEKIGCYNWGFAAGLSQTYEPWEGLWHEDEAGRRDIDFTKWFHDLYRPSLRPYDPREIELIKQYCAWADSEFKGT
jgi:hypothetical protein